MIKVIASFEQEVEGKIGRFYMDYDTPISCAKEMAFAFLKHLGNVEDQVKAQQEKAKQEAEQQAQQQDVEPVIDPPAIEETHVE
jgi:trehalose-6-phosphatase